MTTLFMAYRKASDGSASQSSTQPPVRPGVNCKDPGCSTAQSTKLASRKSDRLQVIPSSHKRINPN